MSAATYPLSRQGHEYQGSFTWEGHTLATKAYDAAPYCVSVSHVPLAEGFLLGLLFIPAPLSFTTCFLVCLSPSTIWVSMNQVGLGVGEGSGKPDAYAEILPPLPVLGE